MYGLCLIVCSCCGWPWVQLSFLCQGFWLVIKFPQAAIDCMSCLNTITMADLTFASQPKLIAYCTSEWAICQQVIPSKHGRLWIFLFFVTAKLCALILQVAQVTMLVVRPPSFKSLPPSPSPCSSLQTIHLVFFTASLGTWLDWYLVTNRSGAIGLSLSL